MELIKYTIFLFILVIPLAYAYEIGGSFGINITVVNSTDDLDDSDDSDNPEDIDVEIFYHSYVKSIATEREKNYAYTGEEVHFEIYVQHDDEVDDVILSIDDEEIECKERSSKLDDGDELGDEFSDNVEYNEDIMDYYECSFVVEDIDGEVEVEIKALEDDDVLEDESEDWSFNPLLAIEVSGNLNNVRVQNINSILLNIKSCDDNSRLLEPDEGVTLRNCGQEDFIIGMVI